MQEIPAFGNDVLAGPPPPSAPGLPVPDAASPPAPASLDAQPVPMPMEPPEPYSLAPQPDFVPFFAGSIPGTAFLLLLALVVSYILWPRLKKAAGSMTRKGSIRSNVEETELLRALERHGGEITPIRAALETRLTVEEADRMLGDLATKGYLQVRATGGRLIYTL